MMDTRDSMKSSGSWDVKRRIKIPALVHAADAMSVKRALGDLPGVREVVANVGKRQLVVRYDASQSAYQTIVDALEGSGFPPSDSWWNRVKAGWYQYADTNTRDNAKAPPSACCNKPPKQKP